MTDDDFREHSCDVCSAADPVELPHSREYQNGQPVHICKRCGFVYVVRRRSAERIAQVWSTDIFGRTYTAAIPAVIARLTYVAEFLDQRIGLRGKAVCEIGAGEGRFLSLIRDGRYGANVFGVEPSHANGELLGKNGIDRFVGTIEQFVAGNDRRLGTFDIVSILWTLENCQDCRAMLKAARALLRPGGHVVVATGSRILVPFKKPLHTYLSSLPADANSFRFSARTLHAILAVTGFESADLNRYIDHDILCAIARRAEDDSARPWAGDNYLEVYNFFERWHVDTAMYFPKPVG